MQIKENVSLASYTTFGIGGNARFFVEVGNADELAEAAEFARNNKLSIFALGGGSNILISDEGYNGLVVKINIRGITSVNTPIGWRIKAGAGEAWDDVAAYAVGLNAGGIENLSLIPGTVGGAVYQNIGAYGVEFKDVLISVKAYDIKTGNIVELSNKECGFEYRHSMFKENKDLIVLETELLLSKNNRPNLSYSDLKKRFIGIDPTISEIRQAVINIRLNKIPYPPNIMPQILKNKTYSPVLIANAGSFFKNPSIQIVDFENLMRKYSDLNGRESGNGFIKLSAAQLIEKAGLKGKRFGDIGVSDKHALVLVNYGNGRTGAKNINELEAVIKKAVEAKFGVKLEAEVEKITC